MRISRQLVIFVWFLVVCVLASELKAESMLELEKSARGALSSLYRRNAHAIDVNNSSVAVLVFPEVHKMGVGIAIETGTGVLLRKQTPLEYYNLSGLAVGLELGCQKFSRVVFFMNEEILGRFIHSSGFEIALETNLVIVDGVYGCHKSLEDGDIQAFVFDEMGLMVSKGISATKVSEYFPTY